MEYGIKHRCQSSQERKMEEAGTNASTVDSELAAEAAVYTLTTELLLGYVAHIVTSGIIVVDKRFSQK